jgi:hypothetical protein
MMLTINVGAHYDRSFTDESREEPNRAVWMQPQSARSQSSGEAAAN